MLSVSITILSILSDLFRVLVDHRELLLFVWSYSKIFGGDFIIDVEGFLQWDDERFDIFSCFCSMAGWIGFIWDRWEGSSLDGVVRMHFGFSLITLVFVFLFMIWVFLDLFILGLSG